MVDIKECNQKEDWNNLLLKTENYNLFSTFQWGDYKQQKNWTVERLLFYSNGNFLGMSQLIYKKKSKLIIGWTNSGINYVNIKYLEDIIETIKHYFSNNYYYKRFSFFEEHNSFNSFEYFKFLTKSSKYINSNFTILHDLQNDSNFNLNSNHRYYYKKSLKNNLEFRINYKIDDFIKIHHEMIESKNRKDLKININEIETIINLFENNYFCGTVYSENIPISSCFILFFDKDAYYYLAGSNDKGRKTYASYLMIVELFKYLSENEFKKFDFMGITPFDSEAFGVNKFKIGFGGKVIEYGGEWEISNSKLLSFLINKVYL